MAAQLTWETNGKQQSCQCRPANRELVSESAGLLSALTNVVWVQRHNSCCALPAANSAVGPSQRQLHAAFRFGHPTLPCYSGLPTGQRPVCEFVGLEVRPLRTLFSADHKRQELTKTGSGGIGAAAFKAAASKMRPTCAACLVERGTHGNITDQNGLDKPQLGTMKDKDMQSR